MGDYWGVEKAHPEIEKKNGVSVLLVNSKKGMILVGELDKYLNLTKSTFGQARVQNSQLNRPTPRSDKREAILKAWREGGYNAVANEYYKTYKRQILLHKVKLFVPPTVKRLIKGVLGKGKNG